MIQLRTVETEKATLQAAQTELEQKSKDQEDKIKSLEKKVADLIKQSATDKAAAEKKESELASSIVTRDLEIARQTESLKKWKDYQVKAEALMKKLQPPNAPARPRRPSCCSAAWTTSSARMRKCIRSVPKCSSATRTSGLAKRCWRGNHLWATPARSWKPSCRTIPTSSPTQGSGPGSHRESELLFPRPGLRPPGRFLHRDTCDQEAKADPTKTPPPVNKP